MNAEPHSHKPTIQRRYPSINEGEWELKYGDQTIRVCLEWRNPTARLVVTTQREIIDELDRQLARLTQAPNN